MGGWTADKDIDEAVDEAGMRLGYGGFVHDAMKEWAYLRRDPIIKAYIAVKFFFKRMKGKIDYRRMQRRRNQYYKDLGKDGGNKQ